MTTAAPSAAKRSAIARPIPRDEPVTIATLPLSDAIEFNLAYPGPTQVAIAVNFGVIWIEPEEHLLLTPA
jgi:hypothetical protein